MITDFTFPCKNSFSVFEHNFKGWLQKILRTEGQFRFQWDVQIP